MISLIGKKKIRKKKANRWSVFVHRYRDVDPRIRSDCIHALGLWMVKLPSIFFDGTYLRYMGWVLSDIVFLLLSILEINKA